MLPSHFHRTLLPSALVASAIMLIACRADDAPRTAADSQAAHIREVVAAGGVVDSIHPIAEHLRRFRLTVDSVDTLRHASDSRDALVRRWASAITLRDSAALNAMVLDRAEFAWLFYPSNRMSQPPYESPPELLWGQMLATSNQGVRKLLSRYEGQTIEILRTTCPDSATVEGENRLYERCTVAVRASGARAEGRLFGTIIERHGRFKFVGLGNEL